MASKTPSTYKIQPVDITKDCTYIQCCYFNQYVHIQEQTIALNIMHNNDGRLEHLILLLVKFGFLSMMFMAVNSSFHAKLNDYTANQEQNWKLINIKFDPTSFKYHLSNHRPAGYEIYITNQEQTLYNGYCGAMKSFCHGLDKGQYTLHSFDFYVRYDPQHPVEYHNKYVLKTIHYLDKHQTIHSVDRITQAPDTPQANQSMKKSFWTFFIFTFAIYNFFLLLMYFSIHHKNPTISKLNLWIFNLLSIGLGLNYLYFITLFLIYT